MFRWPAAGRPVLAVFVVLVVLVVAACTGAAPTVTPTGTSSPTPTTPLSASPVTKPSTTPDAPAPSLGEPPQATLAAEGGDPVAGALGSFTWGDGGSDSPWLAGAPVTVASGEPLTVRLSAGIPVTEWTARRVAAGTPDGLGAIAIATGGATPIAFPAPGRGTWSTQVVVTFGDGLGSAAYYWAITVQ